MLLPLLTVDVIGFSLLHAALAGREGPYQRMQKKLDAVEIACLRDLGQDPETQIEHRGEEKAVADILHQMGGSGSAVFGLKGDAEQGDD